MPRVGRVKRFDAAERNRNYEAEESSQWIETLGGGCCGSNFNGNVRWNDVRSGLGRG